LSASSEIFLPRNVGTRSSYHVRCAITQNITTSRCPTFINHCEVRHSELCYNSVNSKHEELLTFQKLNTIMFLSD
jgi:hypothetical protein